MSTVGVVLGLLITKQPFGIVMSGIGVISLAGIVVNNNIVLIDTFDRLIKKTNDQNNGHATTFIQGDKNVGDKLSILVNQDDPEGTGELNFAICQSKSCQARTLLVPNQAMPLPNDSQ
mgnify:CR=1 FL=1